MVYIPTGKNLSIQAHEQKTLNNSNPVLPSHPPPSDLSAAARPECWTPSLPGSRRNTTSLPATPQCWDTPAHGVNLHRTVPCPALAGCPMEGHGGQPMGQEDDARTVPQEVRAVPLEAKGPRRPLRVSLDFHIQIARGS